MALSTDPRNRTWRWGLIFCLTVAVVARIAMLDYAAKHPDSFDYPDSRRYVAVAQNIAAGRGPMESPENRCSTDPGYPCLLSIAPWRGRNSLSDIMNWGRAVNAILGLAAIVAAMRLARRAAGEWGAIVAGLIMALDPIFLFFHALALTEIPYACLMLWGCEWLLRAMETRRMAYVVLSGAAFAAATLTRSGGLLFPLLLLPLILVVVQPARAAWVCAFLFSLTYALLLLPMTIRNYRILGAFAPVRTGLGATLLDSFGPWADGGTGMQRIVWPVIPRNASEFEREQICRRAALNRIWENPTHALELAGAKLRRTWAITLHAPGYQGGYYDAIAWLTVAPVYILAIIGTWKLLARPALLYVLLAPVLFTTLLHCVFVGSVRYRVPVMPSLFILAAAAIVSVFQRTPSDDKPARAAA